jgi:hypothetical protein
MSLTDLIDSLFTTTITIKPRSTPVSPVYPDVLDSADESAIVEYIQRFYDCETVRVIEDCPGVSLRIRSDSNHTVQPRLLRHLQYAGFDILTITSHERDGRCRSEVMVSRYPPEAYR